MRAYKQFTFYFSFCELLLDLRMITKLTKLIKLRQPDQNMKIDPRLLKYLMVYTKDKDSSPTDSYKLKAALKMKSEDIKVIYNKMVPDDIDNKLAYFILKLSELRKYKRQKISTDSPYVNDIVKDLKKGALGFKVGYFDDFKIHKMRNIFSKHIFEMYYDIYNAANIYHKLKNNNKPVNIAHCYFCNVIEQNICEYENAILDIKDIKSLPYFYAKIWNNINKIKSINLLNECFKDNTTNPSKVMEYYKDNTVIKNILRKSINNCNLQINQFISEGRLNESNTEFFIVSNASVYDIWDFYTIDYGKVPYFIDKNIVEKILVIGKTVFMLKKISSIDFEFAINIESNDIESELQDITEKVNDALKEHFYDKYNVFFCLRQAKQIFLCERADFTSSLYHYLQQHNKGGNSCYHKSIVHLLEKAILDTFNETNSFLSQIDVCILQNEQQLDYVSLFCKLDFPLNTIFTKEIVMKYVSIFRFMWRLKKIESQLRLLRRKKIDDKSKIVLFGYLNVVTKLFTYFFESVIEKEYKLGEAIGIDELRKSLNTILDRILTGMFQVKGKGIEEIDLFVTSLDSMCLMISRTDTREVAHNEVKHNLRDFIEKNQYTLKGTSLHDLCKFT